MARDLIDREPIMHDLTSMDGYEKSIAGQFALQKIAGAPKIDAVEVVRCKDCAHAGAFPNAYAARRFEGGMNCYLCRDDDGYGIANVSLVYPDDYCSDGVRREKKDGD